MSEGETARLLRDSLRRFVEREVVPHGAAWEAQGFVPRQVLAKMGGLGFFGLRYPEKFGGAGLDATATALLAEELGRSTFGGFAVTVLVHTDMASPHLANAGSPAQRKRWMADIVAGKIITAVAVTEPDAGSDVKGIRTRAVRDGTGWRLTGSKMFITNGVHADLYFVAANAESGITMFVVEKGAAGFSVSRKLEKMGWRSSDTAELAFDGTPAELLGEEGRGFYAIMRNFQNERIALGAMAMGEASRALELTVDYVRQRRAFGAPLWEKQAVRQKIAQRLSEVEAGRQLVLHAARLDARGRDCVKEVSMVKAYCGELVNRVLYDCVQLHGGSGFLAETTVERMYRDARVQSIGGGATEVMLEEVAKRV